VRALAIAASRALRQVKTCAELQAQHDLWRMNTARVDFRTLDDRFRSRIRRYVTRLVGEADAEDVTQSVMLKVSEGLAGFRGDSSVSTWLYRIATNVALDRLRQRTIDPPIEGGYEFDEHDLPPDVQSPSVETTAIHEEMRACISEFVARLPDSYKTVTVLSEIEGFKNSEIAAILDVSLDTVKIRLHRAREKLRRDLEAGCTFYRDERAEFACDRKPVAPITFSRRR
jgi:RNA polymerase sigma-70 factor (ECF subfamily)